MTSLSLNNIEIAIFYRILSFSRTCIHSEMLIHFTEIAMEVFLLAESELLAKSMLVIEGAKDVA